MNAHVMAGLTESVRWLTFPRNAQDVLQKLEQFYFTYKATGMMWTPEVLIDLINTCIFNVVDVRDIKRTSLTAVQQLQLADIIMNYLMVPRDETDRLALFNTIFYSVKFQKGDVPLRILSLLGSLAVAFRKLEVTHCLALWMTTATCDSAAVISIALDLSTDFVTDEFPEKYQYLPNRAYLFTSIFLIAIGKAYKSTAPPQRLIDQITGWIEAYPRVCFIPPQSAVFDLFRWCIQDGDQDKSRLHLALISAIDREGKGIQLQVIPHIMTLIQELRVRKERMAGTSNSGVMVSPTVVERGVNMLFQLIQMLINTECLDRNEIHPIFESANEANLPRTALYELLESIYCR